MLNDNSEGARNAFRRSKVDAKDFQDFITKLSAEGFKLRAGGELRAAEKENKIKKEALEKQIEDNKKLIEKQGVEVAKVRNKLNDGETDLIDKLNVKRLEQAKKVATGITEAFKESESLRTALGTSDIFDAFLSKEAEFETANNSFIDNIKKSITELNNAIGVEVVGGVFEDGSEELLIFNETLANTNEAAVKRIQADIQNLKETREKQLVELEDLSLKFTEDNLKAFAERFKREEDVLKLSLQEQNQILRQAKLEAETDRTFFDNRAKSQNRELNDNEIAEITRQTELILKLEKEKFNIEKQLRISAFLEALDDIKQRGGDVEVEVKKLNLAEKELLFKHYKELKAIVEKGSVDVVETRKKIFTKDDIIPLVQGVTDAFVGVFNAYLSFQDAVAQASIDKISDQLSRIDTEISETTSNLNTLEEDLDGKRSGRREALLRGIEIEKDREESLTEKKLELKKKLEAEKREQFEKQKAASIALALINASSAIVATWAGYASFGPAGPVLAGIQTASIAAIAAFEIATIENQTFARGGDLSKTGGVLQGPSHENGGIPFSIGGQPGFEAEGNEIIINEKSSQMFKPLLSKINEAGGGVKFAQGGDLSKSANFMSMSNALNGSEVKAIRKISETPIYVNVTDIENIQARQTKVTRDTSI